MGNTTDKNPLVLGVYYFKLGKRLRGNGSDSLAESYFHLGREQFDIHSQIPCYPSNRAALNKYAKERIIQRG